MRWVSDLLGGEAEHYAYGKVSGMQSQLLKDKDFEAFITGRGVNEIVATLEGTQYERDLQKAVGKQLDLGKLESSLSEHFQRILKEVIANIPEEHRSDLEKLFISAVSYTHLTLPTTPYV